MTEATVTITPAEMVTLPKRDARVLVVAARLFQQIFDGVLTDCEAIDGACEAGLTDDHDCDCGDPDCDVETAVDLKPEFMRALEQAEEICGLAEDEADG